MESVGRVWMVLPNAVRQDPIKPSRSRLPMALVIKAFETLRPGPQAQTLEGT